jgi:hypothetical protein
MSVCRSFVGVKHDPIAGLKQMFGARDVSELGEQQGITASTGSI